MKNDILIWKKNILKLFQDIMNKTIPIDRTLCIWDTEANTENDKIV